MAQPEQTGTLDEMNVPGQGLAAPAGWRSGWADLGGPVHYLDFGGPPDGPVIVCVHGLGGAAVNWLALAPLLAGRCRVLAPDLAGHGRTRSLGRGTGVAANRALLHQFLAAVPGTPVILLGNSMGGTISLLEAAAAPQAVAGLVLLDPALPFFPARPDPLVATLFCLSCLPGLGEMVAAYRRRQPPAELVAQTLAFCCADPSRVPAEVVAWHVELAREQAGFDGTGRDFLAATRSVIAAVGLRSRSYRRAVRSVTCPVLLVHGEQDRLVPVAVARAAARAHSGWALRVLPGVGHVPQLEAAEQAAAIITGWLAAAGREAAAAAGRA
jgi:pimeloyl-ACP methyl ester carboxylesterase